MKKHVKYDMRGVIGVVSLALFMLGIVVLMCCAALEVGVESQLFWVVVGMVWGMVLVVVLRVVDYEERQCDTCDPGVGYTNRCSDCKNYSNWRPCK